MTVARNTATSANSASLSTSWKKSLPISSRGTCPQIASTGACDFLRVVQPVEQVDRAGPDGAHAHPEAAGELGLRAGGERARLLVAHADPLDAVLAPDGVGDRVERVADDTPHLADAVLGERVDQQLGAQWSWRFLSGRVDHGRKRSGSAAVPSRSRPGRRRLGEQLAGLAGARTARRSTRCGCGRRAGAACAARSSCGAVQPIEAMTCMACATVGLLVALHPLGLVGDVEGPRPPAGPGWPPRPGRCWCGSVCAWMQPTAIIIARAALV